MLTMFLVMGCGEKTADTAGASDNVNLPCAGRSEESCLDSECGAMYGWPLELQDGVYCLDESIYEQSEVYAGCSSMSSDMTVETTAGPADGSACWLFSSGAYPEGWLTSEELQLAVAPCE